LRETDRDREHEQGEGQKKEEREKPKHATSAPIAEPDTGIDLTALRS